VLSAAGGSATINGCSVGRRSRIGRTAPEHVARRCQRLGCPPGWDERNKKENERGGVVPGDRRSPYGSRKRPA
jgi:hypothetical protein